MKTGREKITGLVKKMLVGGATKANFADAKESVKERILLIGLHEVKPCALLSYLSSRIGE